MLVKPRHSTINDWSEPCRQVDTLVSILQITKLLLSTLSKSVVLVHKHSSINFLKALNILFKSCYLFYAVGIFTYTLFFSPDFVLMYWYDM